MKSVFTTFGLRCYIVASEGAGENVTSQGIGGASGETECPDTGLLRGGSLKL